MLTRVLTVPEFAAFYQLDRRTVRKMLALGQLAGIRTPAGWRIPDPGALLLARLRQQQAALCDVPFIRGVEVAELLNVSSRRVRRMAEDGVLPCRVSRGRRLYALSDIIAVINGRSQPRSRQSGSYARPWLLAWARKNLADATKQSRSNRRSPIWVEAE